MIGGGYIFQVTGLGGQGSGTGVLVRVRVQENPEPEPGAEDLNLGPDGRDLRPENEQPLAPVLALGLSHSVIDSVLCHRLSHLFASQFMWLRNQGGGDTLMI